MSLANIDRVWPDLVDGPYETRAREYKGSSAWGAIKHHIAKTALGMANLRDGGFIVVGVSSGPNDTLTPDGVAAADLATFKQDDIQDWINKYADPYVQVHCAPRNHAERDYYVIRVEQFTSVPVICNKALDGPPEQALERGTIYVRPPGKVETRSALAEDLREVLDLATDIRLREFLGRMARAGIPLLAAEPEAREEDAYDAELGDL